MLQLLSVTYADCFIPSTLFFEDQFNSVFKGVQGTGSSLETQVQLISFQLQEEEKAWRRCQKGTDEGKDTNECYQGYICLHWRKKKEKVEGSKQKKSFVNFVVFGGFMQTPQNKIQCSLHTLEVTLLVNNQYVYNWILDHWTEV